MLRIGRVQIVASCLVLVCLGAAAGENACGFCGTVHDPAAHFCTHCGRLYRVDLLEPQQRLWTDAFYLADFPSLDDPPALEATVDDLGLAEEVATFLSGQEYRLVRGPRRMAITGRISGWGSRNVTRYRARIEDRHDPEGLLVSRAVHAEVLSKPKRFLYRRLGYLYSGGRLESIEFGTWVYRTPADWKKKPARWIQHQRGAIRVEYGEGLQLAVEVEEAGRDLRGNPEYGAPRRFTQEIEIRNGRVEKIDPPIAREEESK